MYMSHLLYVTFAVCHICCMSRVGQNRIYTPYMTVYFLISLPKILYIHRIYMVLANPMYVAFTVCHICCMSHLLYVTFAVHHIRCMSHLLYFVTFAVSHIRYMSHSCMYMSHSLYVTFTEHSCMYMSHALYVTFMYVNATLAVRHHRCILLTALISYGALMLHHTALSCILLTALISCWALMFHHTALRCYVIYFPLYSITLLSGATSIKQCSCKTGFYSQEGAQLCVCLRVCVCV